MEKLPRIPSPPGVVFRELRIAVLPFVAFGVVLGLTIVTWRNYVGPSALIGEVEPIRSLVTSPQAGRIMVLSVGPLEHVSAGQPLAQVLPADPRVLASQLALSRARIGYLRDALDARLRQQNNEISYLQLRMDWLGHRAELATLRAQQAYFRNELDRQSRLAEPSGTNHPPELSAAHEAGVTNSVTDFSNPWALSRFNSVSEYEIALRDFDSLNAQIEARAKLVEELEQGFAKIVPEEAKLNEEAPAALRSALEIEEREIGLLESQLGPITLKSPTDGVIAAVHHRAGENVVAGELILTVSGDRPERVIAYLRQPISIDVRTNMTIEVRSRGRNRETGYGKVLAVGTQLEPILPELLPRGSPASLVEFGLPFLVSLPAGVRALGGETVDLAIPREPAE